MSKSKIFEDHPIVKHLDDVDVSKLRDHISHMVMWRQTDMWELLRKAIKHVETPQQNPQIAGGVVCKCHEDTHTIGSGRVCPAHGKR